MSKIRFLPLVPLIGSNLEEWLFEDLIRFLVLFLDKIKTSIFSNSILVRVDNTNVSRFQFPPSPFNPCSRG